MSTTATPGDAVTLKPWEYVDPNDGQTKNALLYMGQPGLDIACTVPSRTQREEPTMDKARFAETLDAQDPELQIMSFVVNEDFYDAMRVLKSMTPKDRAILSFHLGQLLSMVSEVDEKDRPWSRTLI